jgi:hypothetical protein
MAIYSDMNNFPESGFPVLADVSDRVCLNTLYYNPLKPAGFVIDVVGANRLAGQLTIAGSLTGATSGAFSTTLGHGGTLTGTIAALYASIDGYVLTGTATGATGVTLALIPLRLSPRIRFIGQAWDVNGAVNTLEQWWQEVIPYPGDTVNSKMAWYHTQGAMDTSAEYQAPEIMNYYNDQLNVLGGTYSANECLTDGAFTNGTTSWDEAGYGWTFSGGKAIYTRSASGSGTLTQTNATLATKLKPNRWYRFTYTTSSINTTVNAYIDPSGVSQEIVYLRSVNVSQAGTYTTTFKTNSSAATRDFVITGYGTAASDTCYFDDFSLKEIISGDVVANGKFTGGGTSGLSIDQVGDATFDAKLTLATTVYKDINLAGALLVGNPTVTPGEDEFLDDEGDGTGIFTYSFGVDEGVHGGFELQHDYKEGTDLVFHVHWQGIAAPTGTDNVQWRLTYCVARDDTVMADSVTIDSPDTAISTQYKCYRTDFGAITGTNFKIGDQFIFSLFRVAATGDAYAGDALIMTAGIHYKVDTLGSAGIVTK